MTNYELKSLCKQAGIQISDDMLKKLETFVDLFIEKNKSINLTKIKSRDEFLIKHIIDALFLDKYVEIKPNMKITDLGTGGGLPGIPLAILYPDSRFTLVDSVKKKVECAAEFANYLHLQNICILSERLEFLGQNKKYREQFDLVIARALAPLPVLLELALPLVKVGGVFVAMKGPGYLDELDKAANAMKKLNIRLSKIERYELPEKMGERYLLFFEKNKPTPPAYPRRVGVPKKSQL